MKNSLFLMLSALLLMTSCGQSQNQTTTVTGSNAKVQIYYFHATHRCPTCISIEANTKQTLDTYFKGDVEKGVIKFSTFNADEEVNKSICEKYQVSGSSLHVVKISEGKETDNDMTNFAFSYSRKEPEKFIAGLKDKISELLK
jgi:hypothetical protein